MIIIEGIDGTGKTSLARKLENNGLKKYHLTYEEKTEEGYLKMLKKDPARLVLDRSFISELVYGPVLRGCCKINKEQTRTIVEAYREVGTKIIYLKADKETLLKRRDGDEEDIQMLKKYYEELSSRYDKVIRILSRHMKTLILDTSRMDERQVAKLALEFVNQELDRF